MLKTQQFIYCFNIKKKHWILTSWCANGWRLRVSGVPWGSAVFSVLPSLLMQLRQLLHQAGAKPPSVRGLGAAGVLLQVVFTTVFVVLGVVGMNVIVSAGLWVLELLLASLITVTWLLLRTDLPTGLLVTLVDNVSVTLLRCGNYFSSDVLFSCVSLHGAVLGGWCPWGTIVVTGFPRRGSWGPVRLLSWGWCETIGWSGRATLFSPLDPALDAWDEARTGLGGELRRKGGEGRVDLQLPHS